MKTGLVATGYNIIGNNADAVINSQPTDQIGTPASPIDPLLEPLADNGGPTLTHALQSGSPAINRGDPADYVLSNSVNRQTAIWYLNNNVYISAAYGPTPPAGWSLVTH
jgi:hypothetical protein